MKSGTNGVEKSILQNLFKSTQGLEAFTIFRRLNLPFSIFAKNIASLEKKGYIIESREEFYKITESGISAIIHSTSISKQKPWLIIPDRYDSTAISPSSYYIPNINLMDKDLLIKK